MGDRTWEFGDPDLAASAASSEAPEGGAGGYADPGPGPGRAAAWGAGVAGAPALAWGFLERHGWTAVLVLALYWGWLHPHVRRALGAARDAVRDERGRVARPGAPAAAPRPAAGRGEGPSRRKPRGRGPPGPGRAEARGAGREGGAARPAAPGPDHGHPRRRRRGRGRVQSAESRRRVDPVSGDPPDAARRGRLRPVGAGQSGQRRREGTRSRASARPTTTTLSQPSGRMDHDAPRTNSAPETSGAEPPIHSPS